MVSTKCRSTIVVLHVQPLGKLEVADLLASVS